MDRKPKRETPSFTRPRRLELDYQRQISQLMNDWMNRPAREGSLEDILAALGTELGPHEQVDRIIHRITSGMVTAVAKGNATSWRHAAANSTQGGRIYKLLRRELQGPAGIQMLEYVRHQADLIRSLPTELKQEAAQFVTEHSLEGERAEVIAYNLRQKFPRMVAYKIDRLARTQVATTATAISRGRAAQLNLNWYEWDTSEDARVRASHRVMDLVLVNWNDPPAPEALIGERSTLGHYHAGMCPNCRCDANVLVDLDQVIWPHKVYTSGRILRMSRRQFEEISGMAA
jgi:SPP1 gp7 family putative phage head morphogenesis protein